jgi:hypothetical protein
VAASSSGRWTWWTVPRCFLKSSGSGSVQWGQTSVLRVDRRLLVLDPARNGGCVEGVGCSTGSLRSQLLAQNIGGLNWNLVPKQKLAPQRLHFKNPTGSRVAVATVIFNSGGYRTLAAFLLCSLPFCSLLSLGGLNCVFFLALPSRALFAFRLMI